MREIIAALDELCCATSRWPWPPSLRSRVVPGAGRLQDADPADGAVWATSAAASWSSGSAMRRRPPCEMAPRLAHYALREKVLTPWAWHAAARYGLFRALSAGSDAAHSRWRAHRATTGRDGPPGRLECGGGRRAPGAGHGASVRPGGHHPWTYVVIITETHAADEQALRQVLDTPAAYIG